MDLLVNMDFSDVMNINIFIKSLPPMSTKTKKKVHFKKNKYITIDI